MQELLHAGLCDARVDKYLFSYLDKNAIGSM